MNKRFRHLMIAITIGVSIMALAMIVVFGYINGSLPFQKSKNRMEKQFLKSKDIIINVAKYMEIQDFSIIYITSNHNEGEMLGLIRSGETGQHIRISDDSISKSIQELFKKYNFSVIRKEKNGIYFQRWANMDVGWGVVYSINGERPINKLITKLEPLQEANWYFYEEK